MPSLFRRDYVTNSNDSYWLSNPAQPLTGFSRIIGDENTERSLRTRIGLIMAGSGRFSLAKLQETVFNNRQYAGELWRDAAVEMCRSTALGEPCDVLARVEPARRHRLARRAAVPALRRARARAARRRRSACRTRPPTRSTRRAGCATEDPAVRQALHDAVQELRGLGLPLDGAARRRADRGRGGERIPIHGGPGEAGVFNAINVRAADLKAGKGYETVPHGSSFVQAVAFTDGACPVTPRTILTYSQSANARVAVLRRPDAHVLAQAVEPGAVLRAGRARADGLDDAARGGEGVRGADRARAGCRRGGAGAACACAGPAAGARRSTCCAGGRRVARVQGARGRATGAGAASRAVYVVRVRKGGDTRRLGVRAGAPPGVRVLPAFERRARCARVRLLSLGAPAFRGRLRIALPARRARPRAADDPARRPRGARDPPPRGALRAGADRPRGAGRYRVTLRVGRTRVSVSALRL